MYGGGPVQGYVVPPGGAPGYGIPPGPAPGYGMPPGGYGMPPGPAPGYAMAPGMQSMEQLNYVTCLDPYVSLPIGEEDSNFERGISD